ncbi:MAG: hypothetical protein WDO71_18775 [Bacteroidota bacterium]
MMLICFVKMGCEYAGDNTLLHDLRKSGTELKPGQVKVADAY